MSEKRQKITTIICVMIGAGVATIAYASGTQHIAYPVINKIWAVFTSVALMSGLLTMAVNLMNLVQSIKNEDAEAKQKAIMGMAMACGLLAVDLLLDPVLNALGFFR